jgi:DNA-binding MarR family transcriptional regulator
MPPPRRGPNTHQQVADALSRVGPLASRFVERLLAAHEPPLTLAQYLALQAVAEGEAVGAELARRAAVSPAAVSQLLAALENAGLIERLRGADDRRRQPLALTRDGERALRSVQSLLRKGLAGLLADLAPPEADALARLQPRIEGLLSGRAPPPRPHRPPPPPPRGARRPR